jgi:hypothetical protein
VDSISRVAKETLSQNEGSFARRVTPATLKRDSPKDGQNLSPPAA